MNENKEPKQDEIDIMDLFARIGRGLKNIFITFGNWILVSVIFILKRWVIFCLSLVLGAGLSYLLKLTVGKYYYSEMIVSSNVIENPDMISYTNNLHIYFDQKNWTELSKIFKLDPDKLRQIKDIEAFWIIDMGKDGIPDYVDYDWKFNIRDTVNVRMNWRYDIRVKGVPPLDLVNIRDGIIRYLENNQVFINRNNERLKELNATLQRVNYDITQLDSLQKIKYFEETKNKIPEKGGQMVFIQEQKTQLVYSDIYKLWERKQNMERVIELNSSIMTIIKDFYPPEQAIKSPFYHGDLIIPSAFLICLIILLIADNRRKLMELYNHSS